MTFFMNLCNYIYSLTYMKWGREGLQCLLHSVFQTCTFRTLQTFTGDYFVAIMLGRYGGMSWGRVFLTLKMPQGGISIEETC